MGPSHIDTFDPKPLLAQLDGKPVPPSFGKVDFQFTKMEKVPLLASRRQFKKRGQSGLEISDLFEHTAAHADDLAVIRSCHHDGFTHITGQNWMNTGWARVGRPSVGSWVTYGLGAETDNLPAYVVMLDGGIKGGSPLYGSGFLPAAYQGTVLRSENPPILNVNRPEEFTAAGAAPDVRPAAAVQLRPTRTHGPGIRSWRRAWPPTNWRSRCKCQYRKWPISARKPRPRGSSLRPGR